MAQLPLPGEGQGMITGAAPRGVKRLPNMHLGPASFQITDNSFPGKSPTYSQSTYTPPPGAHLLALIVFIGRDGGAGCYSRRQRFHWDYCCCTFSVCIQTYRKQICILCVNDWKSVSPYKLFIIALEKMCIYKNSLPGSGNFMQIEYM